MKMKKTQSLKLMLVGLLCSMGMSAWAANGDIFTDKKLVLQEVNGKAQVIAVASHNGTIVIPDEVQNSFDNDKTLKVSRIQQGWWQGGTLVLKREGGQEFAGSTPAVNLLNGGGFILKIEATQLYDITMQEIVPVNGKITQFIVDAAAGLNMLPEHAFQKNKTIVDEAATAANQAAHDAAVAAAEAALNGGDEEVCYIREGKFFRRSIICGPGRLFRFMGNKLVLICIRFIILFIILTDTRPEFFHRFTPKVLEFGICPRFGEKLCQRLIVHHDRDEER